VALTTIAAQNPDLIPQASQAAFHSRQEELQVQSVQVLSTGDPADAATKALELMNRKPELRWRQEIVAVMAELSDPRIDSWLTEHAERLIDRPDSPLALDLYEAAAIRSAENDQLAAVVKRVDQSFINPETGDTLASFQLALAGGDAASGQKIFTTNVTAQCIRCHRLGNEGSDVGPNLAGIASRKDREYLLRSIVEPSADIDPKYRTRMLLLETGQVVQGVVKSESDEKIVLTDAQGKDIEVDVESIEDEAEQNVSIMPDMIKQLSKREIRDLVAYLASLKENPKSQSGQP
jgi:putative heme-binding domain-containing protein